MGVKFQGLGQAPALVVAQRKAQSSSVGTACMSGWKGRDKGGGRKGNKGGGRKGSRVISVADRWIRRSPTASFLQHASRLTYTHRHTTHRQPLRASGFTTTTTRSLLPHHVFGRNPSTNNKWQWRRQGGRRRGRGGGRFDRGTDAPASAAADRDRGQGLWKGEQAARDSDRQVERFAC